jgi:NAD+ kinase
MGIKKYQRGGEKNMIIGIIANITKGNAVDIISTFIEKLKKRNIDFFLSDVILVRRDEMREKIPKKKFLPEPLLCKKSDIIISIGGDGTMLSSSFAALYYDKPVLGVNLGKLGFLAEVNINQIDLVIDEIEKGKYEINERIIIEGERINNKADKLFAINDIVIDKGAWPKMIEITIIVNDELVTTFDADGIIIATPIGTTGYSISAGGPIVSPEAEVITLSPIAPHSLTVRPIVLPSSSEVIIRADSLHSEIQVNCDGQRVYSFPPPLELKIKKGEQSLKLVHTSATSYFETLRNKLLWGIDLRKRSSNL